ncbi:hypothetical protein [Ectobacillus ponti]|uniref:Uncharacterized protein n=1 Tax=Ectobacillus ponti TaxID=2961894 RepID=A0AA41X3T4_9BACI|nr:hypothetical protein [Ectobacillus ponti]MCP8968429.1 hypothetical protein [Ectobacillus ponti]
MFWIAVGIIGTAVIIGLVRGFSGSTSSRTLTERELQEMQRNGINPVPPDSSSDGGL